MKDHLKNYFHVSTALLVVFLLSSCESQQSDLVPGGEESSTKTIVREDFEDVLDSLGVEGSILVYHPASDSYFSNNFDRARQRFIPASTFKIPNSIIALESGAITDSTIFKWNGESQWLKIWEKDFTLEGAFKASCVWCFQEIAREIGVDRMRSHLDHLGYPGITFDEGDLDSFWLEGSSSISQMEQVHFLQGIHQKELGISERTNEIMKKIMLFESEASYNLYAKTGMSAEEEGGGIGWFVGYVERGDQVAYFATNLSYEGEADMSIFPRARIEATKMALRNLLWIGE